MRKSHVRTATVTARQTPAVAEALSLQVEQGLGSDDPAVLALAARSLTMLRRIAANGDTDLTFSGAAARTVVRAANAALAQPGRERIDALGLTADLDKVAAQRDALYDTTH